MPVERSRIARPLVAAALVLAAAMAVGGSANRAQAQAQVQTQTRPQTRTQHAAQPTPDDDAADPDIDLAEPPPKPGNSWIGAGLAFGVLNMPKLGVGVEIVGEARPRRFWPLAFGLTYWFDNESELNRSQLDLGINPLISVAFPASGSRLIARAYQASVATCPYELLLTSGALSLCGGVEGGILHVSSEGFVNTDSQTRAMFAFDAYARWHFRFGSSGIGITYSVGLFVPVLRDSFGYRDRSGVLREEFQMAPVGGRLDLALAYGF